MKISLSLFRRNFRMLETDKSFWHLLCTLSRSISQSGSHGREGKWTGWSGRVGGWTSSFLPIKEPVVDRHRAEQSVMWGVFARNYFDTLALRSDMQTYLSEIVPKSRSNFCPTAGCDEGAVCVWNWCYFRFVSPHHVQMAQCSTAASCRTVIKRPLMQPTSNNKHTPGVFTQTRAPWRLRKPSKIHPTAADAIVLVLAGAQIN